MTPDDTGLAATNPRGMVRTVGSAYVELPVGASPWGAVVPFVVNMYEPESIKRVGSVADAYVGLSEQGWVVRNIEGMLLRSNEGGC